MRSTNLLFLIFPFILQTIVWPTTRFFFWIFLRLKVVGLNNLEGLPKGVIFTLNHTSELDPILVPASLPFFSKFMPMFYVSRPREFYKNSGWRQLFYGGFFFKLLGAHSAISGYKDYGVSLSNHIHIIQRRHSLIIFPEGHKTLDGNVMVNEAHGGVAFLAEKTGLPIVPVCISGAFKMNLKDCLLRRRQVTVIFSRPVYASDVFNMAFLLNDSDNRYKAAARSVLGLIAKIQSSLVTNSSIRYNKSPQLKIVSAAALTKSK